MEFQEVLRRRRMTRAFRPDPIPSEVVDRIVANALHAPSAGFSQGWAFVVLDDRAAVDRFWDRVRPDWRERHQPPSTYDAPVVILPLAHKQAYLDRYSMPDKAAFGMGVEEGWPVPYWDIDTAFAAMLMLLSAEDARLGALFTGIFTGEAELLSDLGVPAGYRPVGAILLGYRDEGDRSSPSLKTGRRPSDEVVHRNRW